MGVKKATHTRGQKVAQVFHLPDSRVVRRKFCSEEIFGSYSINLEGHSRPEIVMRNKKPESLVTGRIRHPVSIETMLLQRYISRLGYVLWARTVLHPRGEL